MKELTEIYCKPSRLTLNTGHLCFDSINGLDFQSDVSVIPYEYVCDSILVGVCLS